MADPTPIREVSLVNEEWCEVLRAALARAEAGETRGGVLIEDAPEFQKFNRKGMTREGTIAMLFIHATGLANELQKL